jgi:hypothetical protein
LPEVNKHGARTSSTTTPREAAHSGLLTLGTGTETVDFTLGKVRPQRDVMDEQMRPRPDIEWQQVRKTLETVFGISDADLKKYDEIPEDAVEAACAPPRPTRPPARRPCACP